MRKIACMCVVALCVAFQPLYAGSLSPKSKRPASVVESHQFADSLLSLLLRFFPDSVQKARIAVFPFANSTSDNSISGGTWVSEYLITKLRKMDRFELVERSEYRRGLRSQDLGPRDLIDDTTAQRLAGAMGAPYLLAGSVGNSSSGKYKVEARIVDAQTGVIVTGAGIEATAEDFELIEEDMVAKRAKSIKTPAALRSMVLPGWGQFYRKRPVMGVVYSVGALGAVGGLAYFIREDLIAKSNYEAHKDTMWDAVAQGTLSPTEATDMRDDLIAAHQQSQRTCGYVGLVVAGVWAVNIVDVIAAGLQAEREYRLYFSSREPGQGEVGLAFLF